MNLCGACWDDTVALNSNDDHGGPATSEGEPITDIVIDGIRAEGSHPPVSLIAVEEKLDIGILRVLNVSRTGTLEAEKPTLFIEPKAVESNLVIRGCDGRLLDGSWMR